MSMLRTETTENFAAHGTVKDPQDVFKCKEDMMVSSQVLQHLDSKVEYIIHFQRHFRRML